MYVTDMNLDSVYRIEVSRTYIGYYAYTGNLIIFYDYNKKEDF